MTIKEQIIRSLFRYGAGILVGMAGMLWLKPLLTDPMFGEAVIQIIIVLTASIGAWVSERWWWKSLTKGE